MCQCTIFQVPFHIVATVVEVQLFLRQVMEVNVKLILCWCYTQSECNNCYDIKKLKVMSHVRELQTTPAVSCALCFSPLTKNYPHTINSDSLGVLWNVEANEIFVEQTLNHSY